MKLLGQETGLSTATLVKLLVFPQPRLCVVANDPSNARLAHLLERYLEC